MYCAIIQARMGSSRLPEKVLRDIGAKPMLLRIVERLRQVRHLEKIGIATSSNPLDDAIEAFAREHHVPTHRGSEDDLLDRFYGAAAAFGATHIVRIWGDCVLLDPKIIDETISRYQRDKLDYCSNVRPATFPRGTDVEVFSFASLKATWTEAKDPFYREYMSDFIWRQPERFKVGNVTHEPDLSSINWCVDYPEDYAFAQAVYAQFPNGNFHMEDVLNFMQAHPEYAKKQKGLARYAEYEQAFKKLQR
jgi:spore coat polysaccharide biosynthesis protein SpsF (cytidylyltransferase family)